MVKKYDAIIIGAGQAGPSLAVRLANAGKKVAIIERHLFGGTCVNVGCIPSKALIASAEVAHNARQSAAFGVEIDNVRVDMKKVKARIDAIRNKYESKVKAWLMNTENCTVYTGHAKFINDYTLQVNDELLEGKEIFINVGGRALIPPMPGLEKIDYLTNSTMMEIDFLPPHLVVIGGSYIGLEFAQMYRRFGSEVTVIEKMDRLVSREDPEVSEAIKNILENEGIHIRLRAECLGFAKKDDKIAAKVDCEKDDKEVMGTHVLIAIGRRPNTDDLGLENTQIKTDARGYIVVDDQLRTSVANIWALGDCNGMGAFTHTSYNDYEIVAANLLDNDARRLSDRITTYALFIDPPLGRAGLTEEQVRKSGRKALLAYRPMTEVKRAEIKNATQGFMKILIDAETKEILGAAILGVGGDEIIHSILDVMYTRSPYTVIQRAMHIHPTVSELIPTMLGNVKPLT